jgi:tetratricopeptide (TPR) repeat protein
LPRFKPIRSRADAAAMRASIPLVVCLVALLASTAAAEGLEELLARSEAAYAKGRLDEAVAILQARLEAPEPGDNLVPVHGTLGDLYLEMANPVKALEHYDWIAAAHPRYARAHYKRGLALEQSARFLEAIDAFALAGEQYYDEAEIRGRIGFNYTLLANLPETSAADRQRYGELARKSLTRAVQLDPRNHSAIGNLADIHFNLGEFQLALDYYERMDQMEPSRPLTLARIGNTYLQMKQYQPALENLLRAARILGESTPRTPADAEIYRDVEAFSRVRAAECLIALNRSSEARSEISRVLELANCPDCTTSTRGPDSSKVRAEELLLRLDETPPADAEAAN